MNEIEKLLSKGENNKTIENLKKDNPDKSNELEETLLNYMPEKDLKIMKTGVPDKRKDLTEKLAYPYEYFNSIDHYRKPVNNLRKEDFFSKFKNKCLNVKEMERTKEIIKKFNNKNREELTELYHKSDVLLLACVFDKLMKVSVNEFGISPLCCISLPGYTWQCGLKYTDIKLQTLQDKDMILLLEKIRGRISSVMGDRHSKSDGKKR